MCVSVCTRMCVCVCVCVCVLCRYILVISKTKVLVYCTFKKSLLQGQQALDPAYTNFMTSHVIPA